MFSVYTVKKANTVTLSKKIINLPWNRAPNFKKRKGLRRAMLRLNFLVFETHYKFFEVEQRNSCWT